MFSYFEQEKVENLQQENYSFNYPVILTYKDLNDLKKNYFSFQKNREVIFRESFFMFQSVNMSLGFRHRF